MSTRVRDNIRNLIDLTAEVPEPPAVPSQGPAPAPRPQYHSDECSCESCCSIRASVDIYLEQKRLGNINDWWNS